MNMTGLTGAGGTEKGAVAATKLPPACGVPVMGVHCPPQVSDGTPERRWEIRPCCGSVPAQSEGAGTAEGRPHPFQRDPSRRPAFGLEITGIPEFQTQPGLE